MKRYKLITIDIEGDISSRICRDNFTEDTLYRDPDTITWLCSIYNGKDHKAMGIRLPHEPRKFISPRKGTIESTVFGWHNPTNQFNYGITDYGTSENTAEYRKFLESIANIIKFFTFVNPFYVIFFITFLLFLYYFIIFLSISSHKFLESSKLCKIALSI